MVLAAIVPFSFSSLPLSLPPPCCLSLFTVLSWECSVAIFHLCSIPSPIFCPVHGSMSFIWSSREIQCLTLNQNTQGFESPTSSTGLCICGSECYFTHIRGLFIPCKVPGEVLGKKMEKTWTLLSKGLVGERHVNNLLAEVMLEEFMGQDEGIKEGVSNLLGDKLRKALLKCHH